jgi:hypothetical protein
VQVGYDARPDRFALRGLGVIFGVAFTTLPGTDFFEADTAGAFFAGPSSQRSFSLGRPFSLERLSSPSGFPLTALERDRFRPNPTMRPGRSAG